MDRRQQKTRTAIFRAFTDLLSCRNYNAITVQDIIDAANIGRSTFYAHFGTKDDLLKALCSELFDHILSTAMDKQDTHSLYACTNAPDSVICHTLRHLQENDNKIQTLLCSDNNAVFWRYFKAGMDEVVRSQFLKEPPEGLPGDFLINHISGSFVEMTRWWLEGGCKQSPQQMDEYFRAVIEPITGQ